MTYLQFDVHQITCVSMILYHEVRAIMRISIVDFDFYDINHHAS